VSSEPRVLRVSIISPAGIGYEGEAEAIVAPAYDAALRSLAMEG